MMGLLSKFGGDKAAEKPPEGSDPNDTEVLDEEPRNMLLSLISQLRIGMDLHRVTLPTFVLEPRSMLERITDFLSHPDFIFGASRLDDPNERFVRVLTYYLSGWHIKPKGVKKPYNPVLGEFFRCRYSYSDGTTGLYVAEQVSHHPPISAFYYCSPEHGELRPKSKFLGNSAATIMEGTSKVLMRDRPEDGEYVISMPNMYARGILFGKMVLELGDDSTVKNEAQGLTCEVEFKTKGFFSGTYNAVAGKIKTKNGDFGEITGKWSDVMELKRNKGDKEVLFDAHSVIVTKKIVAPEDEQEPNESRRLWRYLTEAIKNKDMNAATEAKTVVEDAQRDAVRLREENGETWVPRFFELKGDEYRFKHLLPDETPQNQLKFLTDVIWAKTPTH